MIQFGNKRIQTIKTRLQRLLPSSLKLSDEQREDLEIPQLMLLALSHLAGKRGINSKLVHASAFNQLMVATNGSGLNNFTEAQGTAPVSFSSSHEIQRDEGFLRVDILVKTEDVEVEFQRMDGVTLTPLKFDPGRYSIDFETTRVRVQQDTGTAATYQIIGYFSDPLRDLA